MFIVIHNTLHQLKGARVSSRHLLLGLILLIPSMVFSSISLHCNKEGILAFERLLNDRKEEALKLASSDSSDKCEKASYKAAAEDIDKILKDDKISGADTETRESIYCNKMLSYCSKNSGNTDILYNYIVTPPNCESYVMSCQVTASSCSEYFPQKIDFYSSKE